MPKYCLRRSFRRSWALIVSYIRYGSETYRPSNFRPVNYDMFRPLISLFWARQRLVDHRIFDLLIVTLFRPLIPRFWARQMQIACGKEVTVTYLWGSDAYDIGLPVHLLCRWLECFIPTGQHLRGCFIRVLHDSFWSAEYEHRTCSLSHQPQLQLHDFTGGTLSNKQSLKRSK